MGDERQFGGHRVDGVYDIIVLGKIKAIRSIRTVKSFVYRYLALGVNVQHPIPGGFRLAHSHSGVERQQLPVDVGDADGVVVDEVHRAYAAAGQGLCHIATYATQAEYSYTGVIQFFHCRLPQQQFRAGKGIHRRTPYILYIV